MKYSKTQFGSSKKGEYLLFVLLLSIFAYYLIGIFPLARFETDSMAIANACEQMIQSGRFEENILGHSYHMQSGTYFLIVTIAKIFGADAFTTYSVLTIIFAFLYWIFLVLTLKKITRSGLAMIFLILFLFQEIFALSYYANSAVIASSFWIIAFYLLWTRNNNFSFFVSALLLSIAAWCRVDVAFTFPSVLILLYLKNNNLKAAIIQSLLLSVIVVPATLLLMYLMNANVGGFLPYTQYHGKLFGTNLNMGIFDIFVVKAHAAYFSVLLIFLILFSLIILLRHRNYKIIFLLISGIIFYYLLGINNAIAPKHLSYYTFFWCVVILSGLNYFNEVKQTTKIIFATIAVFLFVMQYIVGLRIDIRSVPYQFEKYATLNPFPTIVSIAGISLNKGPINFAKFVIGSGTKISTPDELSASSGIMFAPLMWYKQKLALYDSFNELSSILNQAKSDTIFLNVTDGSQYTINNLLTNNYDWIEKKIDFKSEPQYYTFKKTNSPVVKLARYSVNKGNFTDFMESFTNIHKENFYFIFIWDWQNYYVEEMKLPYVENITYHIHRLKNIN